MSGRMSATGRNKATGKRHKINGRIGKVKPLSYADIQHIYIDRELNHSRLAQRICARGIEVSEAYVGRLMSGKKLGRRPFGRMVLKAIAEELGVDAGRLPPINTKGGEAQ